jgi:aspartate/methionine/tyrosine aminotransferase
LIVDEVFLDYPLEQEKITSFAGNDGCLTFVMGGLSKTLGMPQMKLAWIILNGPAGQVKEASQRLEMIADTFLSVNTPGQNALPDWLSVFPQVRGNILSRVRTNWETIKAKFSGQENERLLRSDGGWYAMLNLPSVKDEEAFVLDLLKTKKIFAHPGYFFDCDDDNGAHLVISLLTPTETLSEAIDLL